MPDFNGLPDWHDRYRDYDAHDEGSPAVCVLCGALVVDTVTHDEWHAPIQLVDDDGNPLPREPHDGGLDG